MIRAAPLALIGVASLLAWVVYAETQVSPVADPVTPIRAATLLPHDGVSQASPSLHDQTAAWMTTILQRPLFTPSRRPPSAKTAPAATVAPDEAPPRLAGVMVSAGGRGAFFAPPGGKPMLAREGDRVGPYLVRSIAAGEVTVLGPHGVVVLQPAFAGQGSGAAPGPAKIADNAPADPQEALISKMRNAPPPPMPTADMLREMFARQRAKWKQP